MWHKRFQAPEYVYGTEPNEFLCRACSFIPPKGQVLSVAEGEGRNAVFLAQQKFKVTAWDYAPSAIAKTEKLAFQKNVVVDSRMQDLAEAQWAENKWDAIVHIFGHFPEPLFNQTIAGIKQAIKPGGFYIAELFTVHQLRFHSGGPKAASLLCTPEQIFSFFHGWYPKWFFCGEAPRNEGRLHQGSSHVIQCVFQKPE